MGEESGELVGCIISRGRTLSGRCSDGLKLVSVSTGRILYRVSVVWAAGFKRHTEGMASIIPLEGGKGVILSVLARSVLR